MSGAYSANGRAPKDVHRGHEVGGQCFWLAICSWFRLQLSTSALGPWKIKRDIEIGSRSHENASHTNTFACKTEKLVRQTSCFGPAFQKIHRCESQRRFFLQYTPVVEKRVLAPVCDTYSNPSFPLAAKSSLIPLQILLVSGALPVRGTPRKCLEACHPPIRSSLTD